MAKSINDAIKMEITAPADCVKEFNFTIAADAVKSESSKVLSYISSMVQIPGFRAGKAPIGMVKSKYADSIEEELRNRIVSGAVSKIEDEKDIEILTLNFKSAPDFKLDGSEDIAFTFEANIMPQINVGDYKAIKVEVPLDAVEESAVDERLDLYRSMYGSFAEVDGPAVADDMLKASYTSDFTPAEDASAGVKRQAAAEDTFLWLSEPETIPGLIAALTGAEKGKEYTFAATYAADYREEALAGKTVNYTVKVSAIQRRTKLTDAELVEKFQGESIEKMRELIRKSIEQDNQMKRRNDAAEAVCKKLDETVAEFPFPPALLENEIQKELQKIARETVKTEEDGEKFKAELDTHKEKAAEAAKKELRRNLILREIAKAENITVDEAEIDMQIAGMSRQYGYNPKELRSMMEKNGAMDEFQLNIANAKVLEKLVETALD
ncbi:MAG: trigger factor [Lentisphaeria bacterium]|nr:trigger factor [Lentisphaeria bacterium]MBO5765401.1 trigger factor [Lentisphaeria bacterium]